MQELLDRDRGVGVREIADPAELGQREPVHHPLGHAGGERAGEAGIDEAGAQAGLGDGAGGEEDESGKGESEALGHRASYRPGKPAATPVDLLPAARIG